MTFDVLMYVVPNAVSLGYHIHHFPMLWTMDLYCRLGTSVLPPQYP
jgi:hypothetical protein